VVRRRSSISPSAPPRMNSARAGVFGRSGGAERRSAAAAQGDGPGPSSAEPFSSGLKSLLDGDRPAEPEVVYEEVRRSPDGSCTLHQYRRGKYLGKGGFAKVWEVMSIETGKVYACKVVPKANLVKTRARQKLQTEIKIHRVLKHRNICEYKHFFEDRDACYILLELCPHHSMNELMKRRKRLNEQEVGYFMKQTLDGLTYMHVNNVIHRDLKLGNLFLGNDLTVKIGDLGLAAKLTHSGERKKTICGTPNYIAPEIIDSKKTDRGHSFEVDIWSLGVIMFTLLVGKPPYESRDVKSTYKRILSNKYAFPSSISISALAKDLISSMLQTNPALRPSLDKVRGHYFFTATPIPAKLPLLCLHTAPRSTDLDFGRRQGLKDVSNDGKNKSRPARRPLGTWDANQGRSENTLGGVVASKACSLGKVVVNALVKSSSATDSDPLTKPVPQARSSFSDAKQVFNIYTDDTENKKEVANRQIPPHRSNLRSDPTDDFTTKTAAMCLEDTPSVRKARQGHDEDGLQARSGVGMGPKKPLLPNSESSVQSSIRRTVSAPSETHIPEPLLDGKKTDEDAIALENIYKRLVTVLEPNNSASGGELESLPLIKEKSWISCYVDYTSKYGLGFLLNDGSSGVYFNDSTKIVLESSGDQLMYIERKTSENGGNLKTSIFSLSNFPTSLQKKVTLLNHFRSYLREQEKKRVEQQLESHEPIKEAENCGELEDFVYLKKWVRTRHAILFRLSDHTVQVVFFDHSEVIISLDSGLFTYVDKSGERLSQSLASVATNERTDIVKRLRYSRDILNQLIFGTNKA